jgi:hypothetical protein
MEERATLEKEKTEISDYILSNAGIYNNMKEFY